MASLKQHQTDGTYYTVINMGGYVTKQIHPDGVAFLKRNGVKLFGEIPSWLMSELHDNNWLFTKEEVHSWGEIDWSPHWHLIGQPKPKPFPKENPFVTKKRAAARAARLAVEEAERQKLEAKRESDRERGRRYRARKKAEAEAARLEAEEAECKAEAKREAARERRRRWTQTKREEARAARLTQNESSDSHNGVEMSVEPPPTQIDASPRFSAAPSAGDDQPPDSEHALQGSLTQLAPRNPSPRVEKSGKTRVTVTPQPERRSVRLLALLLMGFILLVMAIGQLLDTFPL